MNVFGYYPFLQIRLYILSFLQRYIIAKDLIQIQFHNQEMDKVFDIDSKILSDTLEGLTLTDIERQIILAWFTNPISLYDYAIPCSQKYLDEAKNLEFKSKELFLRHWI